MKNYYKTLNIEYDANEDIIRSTYKALSKIYHPDLYKGDKEHAEAKMQEINEAYEHLIDPIKRKNTMRNLRKKILILKKTNKLIMMNLTMIFKHNMKKEFEMIGSLLQNIIQRLKKNIII